MKFLFRPTTYREVYFLDMASAGLCVDLSSMMSLARICSASRVGVLSY